MTKNASGLPTNDIFDRLLNAWWGKIAVGVFILLITWLMFSDFSRLEAGQVDSIWGPKFIIKVYELVGKWPLVVLFGLVGLGCTGWGAWQLATGKE